MPPCHVFYHACFDSLSVRVKRHNKVCALNRKNKCQTNDFNQTYWIETGSIERFFLIDYFCFSRYLESWILLDFVLWQVEPQHQTAFLNIIYRYIWFKMKEKSLIFVDFFSNCWYFEYDRLVSLIINTEQVPKKYDQQVPSMLLGDRLLNNYIEFFVISGS